MLHRLLTLKTPIDSLVSQTKYYWLRHVNKNLRHRWAISHFQLPEARFHAVPFPNTSVSLIQYNSGYLTLSFSCVFLIRPSSKKTYHNTNNRFGFSVCKSTRYELARCYVNWLFCLFISEWSVEIRVYQWKCELKYW